MLAAFFTLTLLALVILIAVDGYARHLGSPEPTDWKAMLLIAFFVGAAGAGIVTVVAHLVRFVGGLLS